MKAHAIVLAIATLLSGCASTLQRANCGAADFAETTWRHRNQSTGFVQHYRLKRDGSSTYRDDSAAHGIWRLQDAALVIAWNDGYATENYPLDRSCRELVGVKTSRQWSGERSVELSKVD